jgi:hypothetical protein
MMAVGPEGDARVSRLEIDDICDSRKFVSKHVYLVTGRDSDDVRGRGVCCEILRACPLIRRLLLRGW